MNILNEIIYTYYKPDELDKVLLKKNDRIVIEIKRGILDQTPIPNGDITSMFKTKIYAIDYDGKKHHIQIDKIEHKTLNILDRRFYIYGTMLDNAIPLVAIILGLAALGLIGIGILVGQIVRVGVSFSPVTATSMSLFLLLLIGAGGFFIFKKIRRL